WSSLLFENGIGGFRTDVPEYVLHLAAPSRGTERPSLVSPPPSCVLPPAPWINVVANARFGFFVSESGSGHTWSGNSQTNRLTPWSNDPISDPPCEVVYLRDEGSGEVWTPTPLPVPAQAPYVVRHGQGYTVFEHSSHGLAQELLLLVPPKD